MRAGNETLLMFLHALSECHALAPSTTVQAITSLLRQITPTTSSPAAQVRAVAASADTDYDTCGFANGKPGEKRVLTSSSSTTNQEQGFQFYVPAVVPSAARVTQIWIITSSVAVLVLLPLGHILRMDVDFPRAVNHTLIGLNTPDIPLMVSRSVSHNGKATLNVLRYVSDVF